MFSIFIDFWKQYGLLLENFPMRWSSFKFVFRFIHLRCCFNVLTFLKLFYNIRDNAMIHTKYFCNVIFFLFFVKHFNYLLFLCFLCKERHVYRYSHISKYCCLFSAMLIGILHEQLSLNILIVVYIERLKASV